MNQVLDPQVLRFLSVSLFPVIIIGVWVLIIKLQRKTDQKHDQGENREL